MPERTGTFDNSTSLLASHRHQNAHDGRVSFRRAAKCSSLSKAMLQQTVVQYDASHWAHSQPWISIYQFSYTCLNTSSMCYIRSYMIQVLRGQFQTTFCRRDGRRRADLCNTNIMVKKDGSQGFKLVDSDWLGRISEVRYPMNIYRGQRLWRPREAENGQLIKADHDTEMLTAMF